MAARRSTEDLARGFSTTILLDAEGGIVGAGEKARALLSLPAGDLGRPRLLDLVAAEDRPAAAAALGAAEGEAGHAFEVRLRRGGELGWTRLTFLDGAAGARGEVRRLALADLRDERRKVEARILAGRLLARLLVEEDFRSGIKALANALAEWTGCEAVGIRLSDGGDFPYYESRGFPADHLYFENRLCEIGRDGEVVRDETGNPALECMCGNVLRGRFDPVLPFFSKRGSFWTNCTTELLATTTESDRQARTRNRCNGEGYESVALVPVRGGGRTFGLLQFNDRRRGMFGPGLISDLEDFAEEMSAGLEGRGPDWSLPDPCEDSERRSRGLSLLSAHLVEAREEEHRRIAGVLNDEVCQSLVALQMALHGISGDLGDGQRELRDRIGGLIAMNGRSIGRLREFAARIWPRMLEDLGLGAALERLVSAAGRACAMRLGLALDLDDRLLDARTAAAVFAIAEEGLANAVRHSRGRAAEVGVRIRDGRILVSVRDDGSGIAPEIVEDPRSFGISGMRERAAELGGSLSLAGRPGGGTSLEVEIPFETDREDRRW